MSFIRWFAGALLAFALAYVALVTVVNPRREFRPTWFPEVIPNSRGMKVAQFAEYSRQAPVTGLILGSSTSMQLDPSTFDKLTGGRFFNAAVFAGRPEDELAIYRLLKRRGAAFREVVIGVDVQVFDPHLPLAGDFVDNIDLRTSLDGTTPTAFDRIVEQVRDYKGTMGFSYALDIVTSLKVALRPKLPEHAFDPNGRIHSPLWDKERSEGTFDLGGMVGRCETGVLQSTVNYDHLDTLRMARLDTLIGEIRADSARLVLWLPPLHPHLAAAIANSPAADAHARLAVQTIAELARRHDVPLVDLSLVATFAGDTTHWYDCIHYGPDDADRIAARLARP